MAEKFTPLPVDTQKSSENVLYKHEKTPMELAFEESELTSLASVAEEIGDWCLDGHVAFDHYIWKKKGADVKPAFHNQEHIVATRATAKLLIEKATVKEDSLDPLGIKAQLYVWNSNQQEKDRIKLEELPFLVDIAFSVHDLGNILEISKGQGDVLEGADITWRETYTADGAEERSQEMVDIVLGDTNHLSEMQKERYATFIKHLIGETTYMPKEQVPFSDFMRVCDQLSGYIRPGQEDAVSGLVHEMLKEHKGDLPFNPKLYYKEFLSRRLEQLVPGDTEKQQLTKIFSSHEAYDPDPAKSFDVLPENASAEDWIKQL